MFRFGAVALVLAVWTLSAAAVSASPSAPPVDDAALMADAPAPVLSAYHLFTDDRGRMPAARVTPYDIATPLFTDYAAKIRYFYLPPGRTARIDGPGLIDFPVGAVLIKTFAFRADLRRPDADVRRIETRLLIHRPAGWVALTYVWNDAQTEAAIKRAGLRVPVAFTDAAGHARSTLYGVPNVNQCKECHSQNGVLAPIGVKARNLNVSAAGVARRESPPNQLDLWTRRGLMTSASMTPAGATPRWDDPNLPVADRARAYLDANCGHCHSRAGLASNSGLFLTLEETDPAVRGVDKRPTAAGRASGDLAFDIAPGRPDESIVVHRMAATDPGVMMPPIGRALTHEEGVALVRAYIESLR